MEKYLGQSPRKVMLGLLSYGSEPSLACTRSLVASVAPLMEAGWKSEFVARCGDALLPRARCSLFGSFVRSDCERLLMIDDDVDWEPQDLIRMISWDVDVVGGAYRRKTDEHNYPVIFPYPDKLVYGPHGLLEVSALPGGLMAMSHRAAERMVHDYSHMVYWDVATQTDSWALWDFSVHPEGWHGEDYRFCDRWRAMGEKVWCDADMTLGHTGRVKWQGNLAEWLKSKIAEEEAGKKPLQQMPTEDAFFEGVS